MKKLLSSILALTLAFNPIVGYCETPPEVENQLFYNETNEKIKTEEVENQNISSEISETKKIDANTSDTDTNFSNIKNLFTAEFNKFSSYLKVNTEKFKTFINKKAEEQRGNSVAKKQKESQALQYMSTNQYLVHQLKNLGLALFKYSLLFYSVAVPVWIYTIYKSNEGYKKGNISGYNDGKKIGEEKGEQARKEGEQAGIEAKEAGELDAAKIREDAESESRLIIENAKKANRQTFIESIPVLKNTAAYLELIVDTLDGISDSFATNILVAGACQSLDKINQFIDEQTKNK